MSNNRLSINIIYNIANQIVTLLVLLLITPYISRILSPELIGEYSFSLANTTYFVLVESLGFYLYGMIKISVNRDDNKLRSKIYKEIMIAKVFLMFFCCLIYYIVFIINSNNIILNLIMSMNIISNGIDCTWFLMAMEDFKTITLRNISVRISSVVLVFLFVKESNDFILYALIMQLSNLISYISVIPVVNKHVVKTEISFFNIINHTKNSLVYFVPSIIQTIFNSADKTILGIFSSKYEVGVYEQASKICVLCASLINSVSTVILPRVAYLNKNSFEHETNNYLFKSIKFASIISLATIITILCISDEFVYVFFGPEYNKTSVLLQILLFNVLANVLVYYIGQLYLVANSKQKEYNIAISIGAILNVLLNIMLVNNFESVGVSVASVISSCVSLVLVIYYSKSKINFMDIFKMNWKAIITAGFVFFMISNININNMIIAIIFKTIACCILYVLILIILKDEIVKDIVSILKKFCKLHF